MIIVFTFVFFYILIVYCFHYYFVVLVICALPWRLGHMHQLLSCQSSAHFLIQNPLNCIRKGQSMTNRSDADSLSSESPDPGAPEEKLHEPSRVQSMFSLF